MKSETLDIFGKTTDEFFQSLQIAIDNLQERKIAEFDLRTTWSETGEAFVGQLTYYF